MDKLFLDANVIFSATASTSGASRVLFELAEHNLLVLLSSTYALREVKLNVQIKLGEDHLPTLFSLISVLHAVDDQPAPEKISNQFKSLIVAKDLPILCSAYQQSVDWLITLDRKDFMTKQLKNAKFNFKIGTPGDYLQQL